LRYGDWKIVHYGTNQPTPANWELYNLQRDPKEQTNVANQNPERVQQLHALLLKQRAKDLTSESASPPDNRGGD
jgi:arylsulfatase A-like enzyme